MLKNLTKILMIGLIGIIIIGCSTVTEIFSPIVNYMEYGGHTYAITTNKVSWNTAKRLAEENGGYLVSINTELENDFIYENYFKPLEEDKFILWLGYKEWYGNNIFEWESGELTTYTKWKSSEPSNSIQSNQIDEYEDCVEMWEGGIWNDYGCSSELYAVIEFDNEERNITERDPEADFHYYIDYENKSYAITTNKVSWNTAKRLAEENGGYLVSINTELENDFIYENYFKHLREDKFILWLGYRQWNEDNIFEWESGEPTTFELWKSGEPNDYKFWNKIDEHEDCVEMWEGGIWNDYGCSSELYGNYSPYY